MRHDWVFDVLRDLKAYAQTNGLPALALQADEALRVARAEIIAGAEPKPAIDCSTPESGIRDGAAVEHRHHHS